jgi:hypothetical protein
MDEMNLSAHANDPYWMAVSKLDVALTSVLEVRRLLNDNPGAADLHHVAVFLRNLADQIRKGNRARGINVSLVNSKVAARIMGGVTSEKKLAQLARAREARAKKRKEANEYKIIRGRTM